MAQQSQVTKIYQLKTLGYGDLHKELQQVAKDYDAIKKAKREAEQAAKAATTNEDLRRHREELHKIRIEEAELRRERQQKINDAKAEQLARQAAIREEKERQKTVEVAAGSYRALQKEIRELGNAVRSVPKGTDVTFGANTLSYDQAIDKLKELTAAEQAFRRQFQQDGTLVGEYTTGIIQAFKKMGLDDLIGGQVTKANDRLKDLNAEFNHLQQELSEIKVSGQGSLETIERQLIENRQEAIALSQQVNHLQTELRGTGNIGDQITTSLSNGFKDAKGQIGQLVLGYVGFQAVVSGAQKAVSLNFNFEDSVNELRAITGVAGADLEFLKQQAIDTSSRTKFSATEILESFKLIASAKPELLENVEGLNQVKEAAVILAQASGQSLPEAVENLTRVLNQFNADASQSGAYIDALAAGAKFGSAEIPAITAAILEFGTQAKSSNISVQESIGLIELLAEKGVQGAEAGTQLRNVFLAMNASGALGKEARESLKAAGVDIAKLSNTSLSLEERLTELGKISNNNTALVKVFGKENFNAAQIILQNIPRYAQLAEQIQSTGVAQEQATDQANSASTAWAKVRNQLNNLVTSDKATSFLSGLAVGMMFLINNIGIIIPLIAGLVTWFAVYRAQLTLAAFQQGLLNQQTLAYFVLSRLKAAQIIILNGLQAAQNFITATYIALTIRANAATGLSAIAIRALGVAFRFLTGPIGIAITLTTALVTVFGVMSANAHSADTATKGLAKSQAQLAAEARVNAALAERVAKATEDQAAKIRVLTRVVSDETISQKARQKALDELIKISPKYREALQGEAIDIDKVRQTSDELIASLQKQARAKAVADLTAEKEKRKIEIETQMSILGPSNVKDELGAGAFLRNLGSWAGIGKGTKGQQLRDLRNELQDINSDLQVIYTQVGTNTDLQNAIITETNKPPVTVPTDDKDPKASRLTGIQKDAFKDIDAIRDKALAEEQTKRLKDIIDEETYLKNILTINQKAIDDKLKIVKGANAEERKVQAELRLERIKLEQDTNDKIFEERKKAYKEQLDAEIIAAQDAAKAIADDPKSTEVQKAQAKLDSDQRILAAQILFNSQMDQLEKDFNKLSVKNAEDRARDLREANADINQDQRKLFTARIDDVKKAGENLQAEFELIIDRAKLAVQADNTLNQSQKQARLRQLENQRQYGVLVRQGALYQQLAAEFKTAYDNGIITLAQYEEVVKKLEELQGKIAKANPTTNPTGEDKERPRNIGGILQGGLSGGGGLRGLFGFAEGSEGDKLLGEAITQSYTLAQSVMSSYFDAERARIQENLDLQLERIDMEKKRVLARAQSQAEEESIEKQYDAKKKKAQREAGEELKKSKRTEAKLALATELAGIAASAASNPANGPTFGAAGAVMYAIMSALAIGRYAMRVNEINREKFAFGGMPSKGGKIGGRSHANGGTPFTFKGNDYEAEVDELAVIRTKNAARNQVFSVVGTQSQIASAMNVAGGGVSFAPGASIKRFDYGGTLGAQLQAPVFTPAAATTFINNSGGISEAKFEEMLDRMERLAEEQSNRVDRIEVVQQTQTVTNAQRKEVKQSQIGTL